MNKQLKTSLSTFPAILMIISACTMNYESSSTEKWQEEVVNTEREFARMAKEVGIKEAFAAYAANDAVLMRNNSIISGREAIAEAYSGEAYRLASLSWEADFVDVSSSGDMAYTYGRYNFSYTDSTGRLIENKGIFHTVWKKQEDGSWRYVWD